MEKIEKILINIECNGKTTIIESQKNEYLENIFKSFKSKFKKENDDFFFYIMEI